MILSISNLAWETWEDEAVCHLLKKYDIKYIDISPSKYFLKPEDAADSDIMDVKKWWQRRGIKIVGMQSLLFGSSGLNVFGLPENQRRLLQYLDVICRIGERLAATRLVFGSAKNRDRRGLSDTEAIESACHFFRRLGDIASSRGVVICLEPNPPCYGANFMTTSAETALVVSEIGHPAIRMQLDTGAIFINGECPETVVRENAALIGHIHISEPRLAPVGDCGSDHGNACSALKKYLPNHIATIEMLPTQNEPHLDAIERSILASIVHYRAERPSSGEGIR